MKNQPINSKSATLEDIVFEGRNKSYGAYDLNHKYRKSLVIAFFATILGVTSAVAVPLIKAFQNEGKVHSVKPDVPVVITQVDPDQLKVDLPPEPPETDFKKIEYTVPVIVPDAGDDNQLGVVEGLIETTINIPVDVQHIDVIKNEQPTGIEEVPEAPLWVEEDASFRGGDVTEFRKWIVQNITYPQTAIDNGVFGTVIVEFTIDLDGKVSNIKFIRSLDPTVDSETMRVISSSPLWNPAKQGGKPTRQRFIVPIIFQMNSR